MTAPPDPLVVARLQKIGETTDGPSLVQAYMDLLTFGPDAFTTVLAFAHGEIDLALPPDDPTEARRAVLGVLAWLGRRYPDELFEALGDPRFVTPSVACTIESIDDPRTAPILSRPSTTTTTRPPSSSCPVWFDAATSASCRSWNARCSAPTVRYGCAWPKAST